MDDIAGPSSRASCDPTKRWQKSKCVISQKETVVSSACGGQGDTMFVPAVNSSYPHNCWITPLFHTTPPFCRQQAEASSVLHGVSRRMAEPATKCQGPVLSILKWTCSQILIQVREASRKGSRPRRAVHQLGICHHLLSRRCFVERGILSVRPAWAT